MAKTKIDTSDFDKCINNAFDKFSDVLFNSYCIETDQKDFEAFQSIIKDVCQAQRNACSRAYDKHYGNSEHENEYCREDIENIIIIKDDYLVD